MTAESFAETLASLPHQNWRSRYHLSNEELDAIKLELAHCGAPCKDHVRLNYLDLSPLGLFCTRYGDIRGRRATHVGSPRDLHRRPHKL